VVPSRRTAGALRGRLPRSLTLRPFIPRFPFAVLIPMMTIFRHSPSQRPVLSRHCVARASGTPRTRAQELRATDQHGSSRIQETLAFGLSVKIRVNPWPGAGCPISRAFFAREVGILSVPPTTLLPGFGLATRDSGLRTRMKS
jgi:hypothetical protein